MFVVQRSFRTVRRGYDPDEVDRHLELVSQWFTSTDVGQAFTHRRRELEERERAVAAREAEQARLVEGARLEADATLEGACRRADAAAEAAERTLADAHAEAETIRADAERQRAEILDAARAEAAAAEVMLVAEERAAQLLGDANAEAEALLAEARAVAEREMTAARQEREQRLVDARAEAAHWPSDSALTPSRICGPTATAAVARPTGSQKRRVATSGLRRRNTQRSAGATASPAARRAAPGHVLPARLPG